jgi:hypothetical protein
MDNFNFCKYFLSGGRDVSRAMTLYVGFLPLISGENWGEAGLFGFAKMNCI